MSHRAEDSLFLCQGVSALGGAGGSTWDLEPSIRCTWVGGSSGRWGVRVANLRGCSAGKALASEPGTPAARAGQPRGWAWRAGGLRTSLRAGAEPTSPLCSSLQAQPVGLEQTRGWLWFPLASWVLKLLPSDCLGF